MQVSGVTELFPFVCISAILTPLSCAGLHPEFFTAHRREWLHPNGYQTSRYSSPSWVPQRAGITDDWLFTDMAGNTPFLSIYLFLTLLESGSLRSKCQYGQLLGKGPFHGHLVSWVGRDGLEENSLVSLIRALISSWGLHLPPTPTHDLSLRNSAVSGQHCSFIIGFFSQTFGRLSWEPYYHIKCCLSGVVSREKQIPLTTYNVFSALGTCPAPILSS